MKTHLFAELNLFLDHLSRAGIVLFMVVKISVHEQLHCLDHIHIIILLVLDQSIQLYPNIDVWQFLMFAVIKVTQFNPPVHQPQRNLLILFLVVHNLIIVEDSASLVHHFPVALSEALHQVDEHQHNEAQIKKPNHCKSHPSQPVVNVHVVQHVARIERYVVQHKCVGKHYHEQD